MIKPVEIYFVVLPSPVMRTSSQYFSTRENGPFLPMFLNDNFFLWHFFFQPYHYQIKHLLWDANELYNNLSTSNKWDIYCCVTTCFNCGGDHGLNQFIVLYNQTHIALNQAKFDEARTCCSGDNYGGRGHPCGGWDNPGYGNNK